MLPAEHDVLILVYVLARETWHGSTEVRHRRLTIVDQVAHEKLISRAQYFVDAKDSVIFAGGLQQGIADKFVSPTMPVIRTRFRYVLYVGAPVAPILCVVGIQYNAIFLDGIYSQLYSRRAARWNIESRIVNVAAIQGIVGHGRARSISSNFCDIAFGERIRTRVCHGCDADLQLDQL